MSGIGPEAEVDEHALLVLTLQAGRVGGTAGGLPTVEAAKAAPLLVIAAELCAP
jgi:hypothetical protein